MAKLLKDQISKELVANVAAKFLEEYPKFNVSEYEKEVLTNWESLELKARIMRMAVSLNSRLPNNYLDSLKIIENVSPHIKGGLEHLFIPEYISLFGLNYFDESMQALAKVTEGSSSEFAVRPFIEKDQQKAFNYLLKWTKNDNEHIRRLASEGCRPLLPWASKLVNLVENPAPIFKILENLKEDKSKYVQKSVANNINDISKHHPELIYELCKKWGSKNKTRFWILKHGLRTLLKRGDEKALKFIGVNPNVQINIANLQISEKSYSIGSAIHFDFIAVLQGDANQPVRMEYAVDYVKSNRKRSNKVFQIGTKNMVSGKKLHIRKKHSLKNMTTRKHCAGTHTLNIIANGKPCAAIDFELTN